MNGLWTSGVIARITRKLSYKIMLFVSAVILLVVAILTQIFYERTTTWMKTTYIANSKKDLTHLGKSLDDYVSQVDAVSLTFRRDENFMTSLLIGEGKDLSSRTAIEGQLRNLYFSSRKEYDSISFYIPATKEVFAISKNGPRVNLTNGSYVGARESEPWYLTAASAPNYRSIEPPAADGQFFTFHRALIHFSSRKPLGLVSITLNDKKREEMLQDLVSDEGEMIGIFDRDGRRYYANEPFLSRHAADILGRLAKDGDKELIWSDGLDSYLAVEAVSDEGSWRFVKLISIKQLNNRADEARNLVLLVGVFLILFFIPIVMYLSSLITRKIGVLAKQMEKVGEGNFDTYVEIQGNDEISYLSKKFNSMVKRIDELIMEEYKAKLNEKNARMKALEAQINPHFLYNALQVISTQAMMLQAEEIEKVVNSLAKTLRYAIKEGDMVTLGRELEHVEHYVYLQKARFGHRLSASIEVDPSCLETRVPKLSIQPLVENVIKHVLEKMNEPVAIVVRGCSDENGVRLTVSDNGPGITPERLSQIHMLLNNGQWLANVQENIGLKSIKERLQLLMGDRATLAVIGLNPGTEIRLFIPNQ
ncbi:sensor histidine kinase [Cohnella algarum]|uniref:sensor histidine kinase n=1 Tax=Cohnella algarum TaxID=2044859 RepID=UPI001968354F|nr:sensor histidine kinase [Cohnella algarum]MBN2982335.1 sensor histidine kinase [Cohnella algarum]